MDEKLACALFAKALENRHAQLTFSLDFDLSQAMEQESVRVLEETKNILENFSYDDFMCVEEITQLFAAKQDCLLERHKEEDLC